MYNEVCCIFTKGHVIDLFKLLETILSIFLFFVYLFIFYFLFFFLDRKFFFFFQGMLNLFSALRLFQSVPTSKQSRDIHFYFPSPTPFFFCFSPICCYTSPHLENGIHHTEQMQKFFSFARFQFSLPCRLINACLPMDFGHCYSFLKDDFC